ncbi:hypothetical protein LCGC14_2971490, partial [marine sediment metagenome]
MTTPQPKEPTIGELFDLTGKRALVTGASGHLGGAIARALAEAGATVVVGSRRLSRAEDAAGALPTGPGVVHRAVELDQMDEASLQQGFGQAVDVAGGLDVLVNNRVSGAAIRSISSNSACLTSSRSCAHSCTMAAPATASSSEDVNPSRSGEAPS